MTVPLLQLPRPLTVDANGVPRSGAKLYVYAAQTNNPVPVYQDSELSILHPSPITANTDGVFPPIYCDPTVGDIKINLTTAADQQVLGYPIDNIPTKLSAGAVTLSAADVGAALYPLSLRESNAGVVPVTLGFPEGDLRRYGAVGGLAGAVPASDDSTAWAAAVSLGVVTVPKGMAFKIVTGASFTGQMVLQGSGVTSQLYCDTTLLTVTGGSGSLVDNLYLSNITAPWIITRNPSNWAADVTSTLQQSNTVLGYQPTVNDADLWSTLTSAQQSQQIGPTISFTGAADHIRVSRITGRFVRIDVKDATYSSVSDCSIRGGKGTYGGIIFDNATNNVQAGVGNSASNNTVTYASFSGIGAFFCDGFVATGNTCELNGESGIKAGLGANNLFSSKSVVVGNSTRFNYYDGIDVVTAFPVTNVNQAFHLVEGNLSMNNGGDGVNLDGLYNACIGNRFIGNYRFGIWCEGDSQMIANNYCFNNNGARNASVPEILGGGNHNYIVGNRIFMLGDANSNAIFADQTHYIANNYASASGSAAGRFFFGNVPTSVLSQNIDDDSGQLTQQSFVLIITNSAGTLQHQFQSQGGTGDFSQRFVSRINGAVNSPTSTPTASDATTAMAAGGKVGSASTNIFWLDTAAQNQQNAIGIGTLIYNDTGTALVARAIVQSLNINGVTRFRQAFEFRNATTGATFALNTSNIASGKTLQAQFFGSLE